MAHHRCSIHKSSPLGLIGDNDAGLRVLVGEPIGIATAVFANLPDLTPFQEEKFEGLEVEGTCGVSDPNRNTFALREYAQLCRRTERDPGSCW